MKLSRYTLTITLSLLVCVSILAQDTIRWNKNGSGAWHNKNNWMPTQIPADSQIVYIGHDSVAILNGKQAFAREVIIDGQVNVAELAITQGSRLTIDSSENIGLLIDGIGATFLNEGQLLITNCSNSALSAKGINFENTLTGSISINSFNGNHGIQNESISFSNLGQIDIKNGQNGFFNKAKYINQGTLIIEDCTFGIRNMDSLLSNKYT